MWGFPVQQIITLDSNAQGTFDRLSVALNNLIVTISKTGAQIVSALDDLTAANEGLKAEIAAAKAQFAADTTKIGEGLAKIADLSAQIAALPNSDQVVSQLAAAIVSETADLKASVDAAAGSAA